MSKTRRFELIITPDLRVLLSAFERVLRVKFKEEEVERLFVDAEMDPDGGMDMSEKSYLLHDGGKLVVRGEVGEYEPETVELIIEGARKFHGTLSQICEDFELLSGAYEGAYERPSEENMALFRKATAGIVDWDKCPAGRAAQ